MDPPMDTLDIVHMCIYAIWMHILDAYILFVLGDKHSHIGYMLSLILDYSAEMPTSRQLQVSHISYHNFFIFQWIFKILFV